MYLPEYQVYIQVLSSKKYNYDTNYICITNAVNVVMLFSIAIASKQN